MCRTLIGIISKSEISDFVDSTGAFLPPPQEALEEKYKEELSTMFGVEFNKLFTMTNMPIKRFADFLHRR